METSRPTIKPPLYDWSIITASAGESLRGPQSPYVYAYSIVEMVNVRSTTSLIYKLGIILFYSVNYSP